MPDTVQIANTGNWQRAEESLLKSVFILQGLLYSKAAQTVKPGLSQCQELEDEVK